MNFMVIWMPRAQDDLAKLGLDESLRSRIALLAHGLERRLSKDPETMGLLAFDNVYTATYGVILMGDSVMDGFSKYPRFVLE